MAAQTIVENLFRLQLGERDDGSLTAVSLDVRSAGSVAAFAAGVLGRFLAGRDAPIVRVFVEFRPNVGMAALTGFASDEVILRVALGKSGWLLRESDDGAGQERE